MNENFFDYIFDVFFVRALKAFVSQMICRFNEKKYSISAQ
jgi:hypothetical protein